MRGSAPDQPDQAGGRPLVTLASLLSWHSPKIFRMPSLRVQPPLSGQYWKELQPAVFWQLAQQSPTVRTGGGGGGG